MLTQIRPANGTVILLTNNYLCSGGILRSYQFCFQHPVKSKGTFWTWTHVDTHKDTHKSTSDWTKEYRSHHIAHAEHRYNFKRIFLLNINNSMHWKIACKWMWRKNMLIFLYISRSEILYIYINYFKIKKQLTRICVCERCHKLQVLLHKCSLVHYRGTGGRHRGHGCTWDRRRFGSEKRQTDVCCTDLKVFSCTPNNSIVNNIFSYLNACACKWMLFW